MNHSFDIELACEFGIEEAILIHNFAYWIEKNRKNEINFHDGRFWSYDSVRALTEQFPYMTQKKLYRVINGLCDKGILMKGNYNKKAYDRTSWYAFTDLGDSICEKYRLHIPKNGKCISQNGEMDIPENGKCISQNGKMDFTEWENGFARMVTPIPDTTTNTTTDIIREEGEMNFTTTNKSSKSISSYESESTSVVVLEKPEKVAHTKFDFVKALIDIGVSEEYATAWVDIRKKKKATNSEIAFKLIRSEFEKSYMCGMQPNDCVEYAIKREWKGFEYSWVENDKNRNNHGTNIKSYKQQVYENGIRNMLENIEETQQRAIAVCEGRTTGRDNSVKELVY